MRDHFTSLDYIFYLFNNYTGGYTNSRDRRHSPAKSDSHQSVGVEIKSSLSHPPEPVYVSVVSSRLEEIIVFNMYVFDFPCRHLFSLFIYPKTD